MSSGRPMQDDDRESPGGGSAATPAAVDAATEVVGPAPTSPRYRASSA